MWDIIKEIYKKYKTPTCILLIDFIIGVIFVKKNKEPCIGRCLSPISESPDIAFTITMTFSFMFFIWILILSMSDY